MGRLIARRIGDDFFWICPSRFGYLRTPIPQNASFEAQADAYAALLDHLHIEKAAIIGLSIGGPSALLFALRHPDRAPERRRSLCELFRCGGYPHLVMRVKSTFDL